MTSQEETPVSLNMLKIIKVDCVVNMQALGRLERVELRNAWNSESRGFTPWLAKAENLEILGEAIGLELELEAQEKFVGPFRADILCKEVSTNSWVLIENQLERTDHSHLGQLLTYAAGLDAVTIIWIAEKFTEEHRAAFDWLNSITDQKINFFGLEIELWQIGNSPMAPKFNLISKPNDWTKTVSQGTKQLEAESLTPTQQLQLEYWKAFKEFLEQYKSSLRLGKPQPQTWMDFSIGRNGFGLQASISIRRKYITVDLAFLGPSAKAHFHLLEQDKTAIENELATSLNWAENSGKVMSYIYLTKKDSDPAIREQWPEQHKWMCEKLEAFKKAFMVRVKNLDVSRFKPEEFDSIRGEDELALEDGTESV